MSGLCPHHGRALAVRRIEGGRKVDACPTCHGLWLAPAMAAGLVGHALRPDAVAALPPARPFAAQPCPVDGSGMRALRSRGVEIDLCARCKGVWLDAGELERLLVPAAAGGSALSDVTEGAAQLAFDVAEGLLEGGLSWFVAGPPDVPTAASASMLALADSSTLTVERADGAAIVDSAAGLLDGVGEAVGAAFEFVGEALSGL